MSDYTYSPPEEEQSIFDEISQNLYTEAISDILDEMGFCNQVISPDLGIKPLHPDMVLIGRALNLLNDLDTRSDEPYEKVREELQRGVKMDEVWKKYHVL